MRQKMLLLCITLFLFLAGLLLIHPAAATNDSPTDSSPTLKIIAYQETLAAGAGIMPWHDYGSYKLYKLSHEAWAQLPQTIREQFYPASYMDQLRLNAYAFNTQEETAVIPLNLRPKTVEQGNNLHLIQFVGPIKDEWLRSVEKTGTELVHYVAENGYLVWTDENGRSQLRKMAAKGDFLQYSAPYQAAFKLDPVLTTELGNWQKEIKKKGHGKSANSLRKPHISSSSYFQEFSAVYLSNNSTDQSSVTVTIQLYRNNNQKTSEAIIAGLAEETFGDWQPILNYQNLRATLPLDAVWQIAQLPDVVWVGQYTPPQKMDEVQGQIMAAQLGNANGTPTGPGYLAWLNSLGFSQNPADYPIVDITDDGIGNGDANSAGGDVTLRQQGNAANPSRLAYIDNCTESIDGQGPDGHGHLNVSIAGGYDARAGFPYRDANGYQLGLGINPYGRFAGTRVFAYLFDLSRCDFAYSGLIQRTYQNGARISSNSWSCGSCSYSYNESSQAYDAGVRDADPSTPGNQELTFIFSAGNGGPSANTVGTPGNAKNVVAVGASENVRPTWSDGCGIDQFEADNAMDIPLFSSRGPTPGGRVKPDMVAPGTHIQGTASTIASYNGINVCDQYHPQNQQVFAASSGTSHSAPAVAGAASLVTYWLENKLGFNEPSPALLKSYLIAHPTYLTGAGANDRLPSNNQGFGMPDLSAAFASIPRMIQDQSAETTLEFSGDTWTYTGSVQDPSQPVRIVLAYTDYPGMIGVNPKVNDLNLSLKYNNAAYWGNQFEGQWSVPDGEADSANNVEAIFLPPGNGGQFTITVTGFNIAGDGVPGNSDPTDQDFALVCVNCLTEPDFILTVEPERQAICQSENAAYTLTASPLGGFNTPVNLSAANLPAGLTAVFSTNQVQLPGSSILTLSNTQQAAPGTSFVQVTGSAGGKNHTINLDLVIDAEPPEAVELISPANGSQNLPTPVMLTWTTAAHASEYNIQIAADVDFKNIIEETAGLTTTTYMPANLASGKRYFWRVIPANGCGENYSDTFTFTTEPEPGECPVDMTTAVLYSEGFENSAAGWTHAGTNDTWRRSTERAHAGEYAFFAQDLPVISDQRLTSPRFDLPTGLPIINLKFWNYYDIEIDLADNSYCYDGGILEISTDNGASWQQLVDPSPDAPIFLTNPYTGIIKNNIQNPLAGLEAWCGSTETWKQTIVALDAYGDESVTIRFRLGTDNSVEREGWHIDQVELQTCQMIYPPDQTTAYLPLVKK